MRRAVGALLVSVALGCGVVLGSSATAADLSVQPSAAAWFDPSWQTAAQPAPPLPPDVTATDLYLTGAPDVVGTAGGVAPVGAPVPVPARPRVALAYVAMHFDVPPGTTAAKLTLTIGGMLPTATVSTASPVSPLACLTTKPWTGAGQTVYTAKPDYDCARSSSAKLSADKLSLEFNDIGLLQKGNSLDLVILTNDPGNQRLVLSVPATRALTLLDFSANQTGQFDDTAFTPPVFSSGTAPVAAPGSGPAPVTSAGGGSTSDGYSPALGAPDGVTAPGVTAPGTADAGTGTVTGGSQAGTASGVTQASPASSVVKRLDDSFGRRGAIGGLAVLVVAGLWLLMTEGGPVGITGAAVATPLCARRSTADDPAAPKGVGRFRSPRTGDIPRL